MTLEEHIADIRDRIQQNDYPNERRVSEGIVLRLLHDGLGWPRWERDIVHPERQLHGDKGKVVGRIDFALCHPAKEPRVFIEVKAVGQIDGSAEEQVFSYAYQHGVPIVVLTDGRIWRFFYTLAVGEKDQRKVIDLNLVDDAGEKVAQSLMKYLRREAVVNGEAMESIRLDHRKYAKQNRAEAALPGVWEGLIEKGNSRLLNAVADAVESNCGDRPTNDQVLRFLNRLELRTSSPEKRRRKQGKRWKLVVTMPDGAIIEDSTATNIFTEAIVRLGIERVKALGLKYGKVFLISEEETNGSPPQRMHEGYYIALPWDTPQKKEVLEKVAAGLDETKMRVEIAR